MDTAFTPREGKPVEINALWIHALDQAESMGIIPPVSGGIGKGRIRGVLERE